MRIIDDDILSYALYDEHIAHAYAWPLIERAIRGELSIYVTQTTILETYNTLYWFYRVRPRSHLIKKLLLTLNQLRIVNAHIQGLNVALRENIPLGDGFLIATAKANRIPVILSNDEHIAGKATKYGLMVENPIPPQVKERMGKWKVKAE